MGYVSEVVACSAPELEECEAVNATWINGAETTAPGATTQLVKIVTSAGKVGRVYGLPT